MGSQSLRKKKKAGLFLSCPKEVYNLSREIRFLFIKRYNKRMLAATLSIQIIDKIQVQRREIRT